MEKLTSEKLKHYEFFSGLSDGALEELAQRIQKKQMPAGTVIIKEGDPGDAFYILCKGDVEITRKTEFGQTAKVASASAGDSFGEMALLTNMPRNCTVTAKTDVTMSVLTKDDFDQIVSLDTAFSNLLQRKSGSYDEFNRIKTLKPFALVEPEKMLTLIEAMQTRKFAPGETIISQGEKSNDYYIIKSGKVAVIKKEKGKEEAEQVAVLNSGEGFGEEAIIRDMPRNASIRTVEETEVLMLDKKTFENILGMSFLVNAFPEDVIEELGDSVVLIDARIPPEYKEEHIKGALNIPIEILRQEIPKMDKAKKYYTYCTNDSRGMTAAFLMKSMGFDADALRGGLSGWEGETVRGDEGVHPPSM